MKEYNLKIDDSSIETSNNLITIKSNKITFESAHTLSNIKTT